MKDRYMRNAKIIFEVLDRDTGEVIFEKSEVILSFSEEDLYPDVSAQLAPKPGEGGVSLVSSDDLTLLNRAERLRRTGVIVEAGMLAVQKVARAKIVEHFTG